MKIYLPENYRNNPPEYLIVLLPAGYRHSCRCCITIEKLSGIRQNQLHVYDAMKNIIKFGIFKEANWHVNIY